jgi:hypothetical protein
MTFPRVRQSQYRVNGIREIHSFLTDESADGCANSHELGARCGICDSRFPPGQTGIFILVLDISRSLSLSLSLPLSQYPHANVITSTKEWSPRGKL